jgi:hypothetical protein
MPTIIQTITSIVFMTGSFLFFLILSEFAPKICQRQFRVHSAFIIAAWIAGVWVKPFKSHGCASQTNLSSAGLNQPGSSRLPAVGPMVPPSPPSRCRVMSPPIPHRRGVLAGHADRSWNHRRRPKTITCRQHFEVRRRVCAFPRRHVAQTKAVTCCRSPNQSGSMPLSSGRIRPFPDRVEKY